MNHKIILGLDRLIELVSDAGIRKDNLNQNGSGHHIPQRKSQGGQLRQQAVTDPIRIENS